MTCELPALAVRGLCVRHSRAESCPRLREGRTLRGNDEPRFSRPPRWQGPPHGRVRRLKDAACHRGVADPCVALCTDVVDLRDSPFVATAFEVGCQPCLHDGFRFVVGYQSLSERQDVRVVMLASPDR